jgi:hypothetical protein
MAYTSLNALLAAIRPKSKGESMIGVKKSSVWISAVSGLMRNTPASSECSKPTSRSGCFRIFRFLRTESRTPGLSFAAQPDARTFSVNGISVMLTPVELGFKSDCTGKTTGDRLFAI